MGLGHWVEIRTLVLSLVKFEEEKSTKEVPISLFMTLMFGRRGY